jgi:hypothetical protein
MQVIRDCEFLDGIRHDRQLISDYQLENCTFDSWSGVRPDWSNPDPELRATIRNVTLRKTNAYHGYLQGTIIEEVVVDTTKGGKGPLFLRGNAYKHVTLKGRISATDIRGKMLPPWDLPADEKGRIIAEWDQANREYYRSVDWALDIREANYASLSISGVPARLIRRNSDNTAVVTRERALAGEWKQLPFKSGLFKVIISQLIKDGYDDELLIACPRGKRYADNLYDLMLLRDAGIAE